MVSNSIFTERFSCDHIEQWFLLNDNFIAIGLRLELCFESNQLTTCTQKSAGHQFKQIHIWMYVPKQLYGIRIRSGRILSWYKPLNYHMFYRSMAKWFFEKKMYGGWKMLKWAYPFWHYTCHVIWVLIRFIHSSRTQSAVELCVLRLRFLWFIPTSFPKGIGLSLRNSFPKVSSSYLTWLYRWCTWKYGTVLIRLLLIHSLRALKP